MLDVWLAQIAALERTLDTTKSMAARLASSCDHHEPTWREGGIERLREAGAARSRWQELARDADHEIAYLIPDCAPTADHPQLSPSLLRDLRGRDVTVRGIHPDGVRDDMAGRQLTTRLDEQGGAVRTLPALPLDLQIIDRRTAVIPVDQSDLLQGVLVIDETGPVAALQALFDGLWQRADPLGVSPEHRQDGLGGQSSAVLRLLAQGLTDTTIARRLGISLRTERRIITDLMARLGAQSRFQLGQQAALRGYL
jgi:DNA-binding CsgD family transcriptional regulator